MQRALVDFFDAFRRSRARLQRDPGLGQLTLSEFALLRAVAEHGDDGVSRIAQAADMAQPPASRGINRLAARRLVARSAHADDGRLTTVSVTPIGRQMLSHHRKRLHRAAQLIADRLGVDGAPEAPNLLRRLAAALEETAV